MSRDQCKIFFITAASYGKKEGNGNTYVETMRAFLNAYPNMTGDEQDVVLDAPGVFYRESADRADLSAVSATEAIEIARRFSMRRADGWNSANSALAEPCEGVDLLSMESELFYDSHACFCLVTEVELAYDACRDENELLANMSSGRAFFDNLGIRARMDETRALAQRRVSTVLARASLDTPTEHICFEDDNTLPLIMFAKAFPVDLNVYRNEERVAGVEPQASLAQDYTDAFFYPGWNYTVASGLPYEVFVNLLQVMIASQAFYFTLGHLKSYFADELAATVRMRHAIGSTHVDCAEEMRLAFYDLLAKFNAYKNNLFPKYYDELEHLLGRWHCDRDIEDIKEYIDLNLQAKNGIRTINIEKHNRRQDQALTFIAFMQIVSIYGVFSAGIDLFASEFGWLMFCVATAVWAVPLLAYWIAARRSSSETPANTR